MAVDVKFPLTILSGESGRMLKDQLACVEELQIVNFSQVLFFAGELGRCLASLRLFHLVRSTP